MSALWIATRGNQRSLRVADEGQAHTHIYIHYTMYIYIIQCVRCWTRKTESPAATAQEGASGRGAPSEAALFGVYGSVGDFGKHTHRECAVMESLVTKQKRVKHIYR